MRDAGACVKGVFDPLADGFFLAVGAVQVDLMQDTGAVPGPRGDLCGRAAGVQLQRQGGVPQVVGAAGERADRSAPSPPPACLYPYGRLWSGTPSHVAPAQT